MFSNINILKSMALDYLKTPQGHNNILNASGMHILSISLLVMDVYDTLQTNTFTVNYDNQQKRFTLIYDIEKGVSFSNSLNSPNIATDASKLSIFQYKDVVKKAKPHILLPYSSYILTDYGVIEFMLGEEMDGVKPLQDICICLTDEGVKHLNEIEDYINDILVDLEKNSRQRNLTVCMVGRFGLKEKNISLRPIECDVAKNYNNDLPYEDMIKLLHSDKQELMLFYGEPGTGKTSLIKKLIIENPDINFVYFDFKNLSSLTDADVFHFFEEHQNNVLILEDCEKILINRNNGNPFLDSMLNLTDGIIGEALNIKFICTFNCPTAQIDQAILREGRLSLIYEFTKLSLEKTRELYPSAQQEMTLSQIFCHTIGKNQGKKTIGF